MKPIEHVRKLLTFNTVLGYVQENHANQALGLLRQRLTIRSRVRRDSRWQLIPAKELVPGDVVHLRVGDVVPADIRLVDGELLVEDSHGRDDVADLRSKEINTCFRNSCVIHV